MSRSDYRERATTVLVVDDSIFMRRMITDLIDGLQGQGIDVYTIGDCLKARDAMEAINEGAEIVRAI